MDEKSLMKKAKKTLKRWSASLDDLTDHLHADSDKAIGDFEKHKNDLNKWIDKASGKLKNAESLKDDEVDKLRSAYEELKSYASKKEVQTEEELKGQRENLSDNFEKFKNYLHEVYKDSENTAEGLSDKTKEKLEHFQTKFDLFKLRAEKMEGEAEGSWKEKKKELSGKIKELSEKIESNKEISSDMWDDFSDEMSVAWKHIRKAFKS